MQRVGLVFGGRSVEHQVSVRSARTVAAGLDRAGHEVVPLGVATDGSWVGREASSRALAGELDALSPVGDPVRASALEVLRARVDLFFPIIHGTWGEDGTLQGFFETVDVPYVGAGVAASALCMDKARCKAQLATGGIPVVDAEVVTRAEFEADFEGCRARLARLAPPLFVKPSAGGSSVGVKKLHDLTCLESSIEAALRFDETVLVERGIDGREIECGVLGYRDLEASAVGEIRPGREFYDYADKYLEDTATLELPAKLPAALTERIRALAVEAFAAVGGVGMARVDFLLAGEDTLYLNEINTLPGFTEISMYPKLWQLAGIPLPDLVARLVDIALRRHEDRQTLHRGIRDWVESLED